MRLPYVREIGLTLLGLLFVAYSVWLYRDGGKAARLDCANRENAELQAQRKQIEYWQQYANEKDEALQKALKAQPHTGSKVERAVHDHPTRPDCIAPDPVIDELQDGIRAGAANTAP